MKQSHIAGYRFTHSLAYVAPFHPLLGILKHCAPPITSLKQFLSCHLTGHMPFSLILMSFLQQSYPLHASRHTPPQHTILSQLVQSTYYPGVISSLDHQCPFLPKELVCKHFLDPQIFNYFLPILVNFHLNSLASRSSSFMGEGSFIDETLDKKSTPKWLFFGL